jgi:rod shape-determining protein MreB
MFVKGKGIILRSPTVVTIDKEREKVVAIGREAKMMIGKTPSHMEAYRPIRNGVVADFEVTTLMLREYLVTLPLALPATWLFRSVHRKVHEND